MAWRAIYRAEWGRVPVDVTVGGWDEARRILAAELEESLRGEDCDDCRAQCEIALRTLSAAEGREWWDEVDGELYRLTRVS